MKCQVYSRVVGYLSPISTWNKGKAEEFKDRRTYEATMSNVSKSDEPERMEKANG